MSRAITKVPKAIYDWFKGDQAAGTIYAALGGRLSRGQAPTQTAWPFGTFHIIDGRPDWAEDLSHEFVRVQFSLFAENDPDCAKVDALADKLMNRFDEAVLTFSGSEYWTVWFRRVGQVGGMPANPGEHDRRSMATVDYEHWIEEQ